MGTCKSFSDLQGQQGKPEGPIKILVTKLQVQKHHMESVDSVAVGEESTSIAQ